MGGPSSRNRVEEGINDARQRRTPVGSEAIRAFCLEFLHLPHGALQQRSSPLAQLDQNKLLVLAMPIEMVLILAHLARISMNAPRQSMNIRCVQLEMLWKARSA